jgi:hypothetical protein
LPVTIAQEATEMINQMQGPAILVTPVSDVGVVGYARMQPMRNGYLHITAPTATHGPDGRCGAYWGFRAVLQLLLKLENVQHVDYVLVAPFGDPTPETAAAMHAAFVHVLVYTPYALYDNFPMSPLVSSVVQPTLGT